MKNILFVLCLLNFCLFSYSQRNFYCNHDKSLCDSMKRAWYPYQIIDSLVFPDNDNFIIVNSDYHPGNFVSRIEKEYRKWANVKPKSPDEFHSFKDEYPDYQTYLSAFKTDSLRYDSLAKTEHEFNNKTGLVICIQNKKNQDIYFLQQDGSLVAIIEALDHEKKWKPVQYWWYSWCGNSYHNIILRSNSTLLFVVNNKLGNTETKMRLKIHGKKQIYVSNEFSGSISPDNFIIKSETKQEMMKDKRRISFLKLPRS